MAGSAEAIYWDTCIFYALLLGGTTHGEGVFQGIEDQYKSFIAGSTKLMTFTIAVAEVAAGNFVSSDHLREFKELRYASGFNFSTPTFPIMELASEIKDYYFNNPLGLDGKYKHLDLGDAIHLATAIKNEASKFVTLDAKNKSRTDSIGLLKIGTAVAEQYQLDIVKPEPPKQIQMSLPEGGR